MKKGDSMIMNELDELFDIFGESSDDFDPDKDLEPPKFDEGGSDDVDTLLDSITTGDTGDSDDDGSDDLDELEKEYHITAAGAAMDPDPIDDEFPELDEACAGECEDVDDGLDDFGDIDPAGPLDPELDARGDQMLASLMTPDLAETMLSDDEYSDFVESGDITIAADEGWLDQHYVMEAMDCDDPFSQDDIFAEAAFAPEGKKFKMTKSARLKQLYQVSLQIEARLHNDPGYARMQKVYQIRRDIRKQWHRRYGALAMRRAKRYLKGIMSSKSKGIKTIASLLVGTHKVAAA